ncbi:MAG: L-threonylcarbamoyladenylate synthase [Sphingobacteriaceae bacterium]|nr:L-threonylcarbamoyladenylate synthase [Sphingobacteriaceae bacterium]
MNKLGTDLHFAAAQLRAGKLVGIPTETVYGLAANALDPVAVASIFEAKNRPAFDPLIVHLASFEQAQAYCQNIPDLAYQLAAAFCPGPITFILPKNTRIPDLVSSGQPTVGIRIPNHPLTLQLLQQLDFPLAAPSANPFGYVSPTTAQHVADQLGDKIAYILDGGACEIGLESTIIDLSIAAPKVLRLGGLALEQLEAAVGQKLALQTSSSNPKAPGMLLKHYAPNKRLRWAQEPASATNEPLADFSKTAWLRFSEPLAHVPLKQQFILSPSGDFKQAANRLFALLRELDNSTFDLILVEKAPEIGLGRAINDRLKRAVTP